MTQLLLVVTQEFQSTPKTIAGIIHTALRRVTVKNSVTRVLDRVC